MIFPALDFCNLVPNHVFIIPFISRTKVTTIESAIRDCAVCVLVAPF